MSDNTMNRQAEDTAKERIHGSSEIEEAIMKAIDAVKDEKTDSAQRAHMPSKSNSQTHATLSMSIHQQDAGDIVSFMSDASGYLF